jgi:hypothetical protein
VSIVVVPTSVASLCWPLGERLTCLRTVNGR